MSQNQKPKWIIPVISVLVIMLISCIVVIYNIQMSGDKKELKVQETPVPTAIPTKSPEEQVLEEGERLYRQGEYVEAINTLKELESNLDASSLISKCYFEYGRKLRAAKEYKHALAMLKKSSELEAEKEIAYCENKILENSDYLEVRYAVNQTTREEKGNFFKNGEGTLKFSPDIPLDPWCGDGTYVTYCEPNSKIHFQIANMGKKTLKNVTLILSFNGLVITGEDTGEFTCQDHCNGIGGWGGAVATYGKLESGLCIDTMFSVQNAYSFNGADGGTLTLTISADNYKARSYEVPIKIKR